MFQIRPIDEILTETTLDYSGPGSNDNKRLTLQSLTAPELEPYHQMQISYTGLSFFCWVIESAYSKPHQQVLRIVSLFSHVTLVFMFKFNIVNNVRSAKIVGHLFEMS